jgi:hypothetical protein
MPQRPGWKEESTSKENIFNDELLSENTTTKGFFDFAGMEKYYGERMKMKDSAGDII